MRTLNRKIFCVSGALAAAVMSTGMNSAVAQDDEDLAKLTKPESYIGAGISGVTGNEANRSIWGQYNGMRVDSGYLLLDFDYNDRDDATGQWTKIYGYNLGLDTREAGVSFEKQGDWRLGLDLSELVHRDIYTVNTGMLGIGSTTPTIPANYPAPGGGTDYNPKTTRLGLGLSGNKWITQALQFQFNVKSEDKKGTRSWGRGYDCSGYVCLGQIGNATSTTRQRWAVLWIPEDINSNITQVDTRFNFHTDKLFLSGGYYGSFYNNKNGNMRLTVPGSLNNPFPSNSPFFGPAPLSGAAAGGTSLQNVLQMPVALPPDNQANQFYLTGNYVFTPKVRVNFKASYTHATQDSSFASMGLTDGTQPTNDLGGELNTTLLQARITARPIPKLTLNANVRYENKKDKTPIAVYNVEDTDFWQNPHLSNKNTNAKIEASYLFPTNIRGTFGVDYEKIKRELPPPWVPGTTNGVLVAGLSGLRGETQEWEYRAELRRSISETLTGALSYRYSERDGSDYYFICGGFTPCAPLIYGGQYSAETLATQLGGTGVYPYMLQDRKTNRLRATADWSPLDRLSIQFMVENQSNRYDADTSAGLQKTNMTLYSLDSSYALSNTWKLTAYASLNDQKINTGQSSGYRTSINDRTTAFGLGLTGKPTSKWEVGGKLSYLNDVTKYPFTLYSGNTNAAAINQVDTYGGLPNVAYREFRLNAYGQYALKKNSDLRFDLIYFRAQLHDFNWTNVGVPFTYQDNTTVTIDPNQQVWFVGVTYIYKMK
jgi:MtrB/PioB family decaheme-associated outer membrane protein